MTTTQNPLVAKYVKIAEKLIQRSPYNECDRCKAIFEKMQGIIEYDDLVLYLAGIEEYSIPTARSFASELIDGW